MEDKRGRGRGRSKVKPPRDEDYVKNPTAMLAFKLPERERQRGPNKQHGHKPSLPFKKERHLQSNTSFANVPLYSVHTGTTVPVKPLLRLDTVFVTYTSYKPYECSICLFPPTCPRITPCAHIFCWTCAIQYFAMKHFSGLPEQSMLIKHSCPCPVCKASFELGELRSVDLECRDATRVKDIQKFTFVTRDKLSTVIHLHGHAPDDRPQREGITPLLPFPSRRAKESRMNRFTIAFAEDMESIWEKEEKELVTALDEALSSSDPSAPIHLFSKDVFEKQRESYRNDSSKYVSFPSGPITEKVGEIGETSQLKYYFYQLDTGENVYMHSLNITWLLKQFSDYAHFPQTVEGSVIDIEGSITQDEKRYRFLGHLPIACNYQFCLIDISGLLSKENVAGFKGAVKQRRQQLDHEKSERLKLEKKQLEEAKNNSSLRNRDAISGISQSQALLYERLTNLETLTNDAVNFPSFPTNETTEERRKSDISEHKEQKPTQWENSSAFRQRLEELSDYTPVASRNEEFPELVGGTSTTPSASATAWGSFAKKTNPNSDQQSPSLHRHQPQQQTPKPKRGKGKQKQVLFSTGL